MKILLVIPVIIIAFSMGYSAYAIAKRWKTNTFSRLKHEAADETLTQYERKLLQDTIDQQAEEIYRLRKGRNSA